jgi:DNA repair ATPase RecN
MTTGFFIAKISIQGQGLPPAELSFSRGANVITGLSDTGKSYVFSVLNYALGRSTEPKEITECIGYTHLYLEIETYVEYKIYTIHRPLKGKDKTIEVKECKLESYGTSDSVKRIFKNNGQLDSDESYSNFLLTLIGLNGRKILFNKTKGRTNGLSFSNLIQLAFISESRIITEESPFYFSAQNTHRVFD